jgi:hypothetical protein
VQIVEIKVRYFIQGIKEQNKGRYDEIRAFKVIPRNHKFAEAKGKERCHLMSSGTVNYHRTNHRTDTTICEQNIREHLTSHGMVAPGRTSDCTRWSARHGGRSGDF